MATSFCRKLTQKQESSSRLSGRLAQVNATDAAVKADVRVFRRADDDPAAPEPFAALLVSWIIE